MVTCEAFEQELREALAQLDDPSYRPSDALCAVVGCEAGDALGLQAALLRAIAELEPKPGTPPSAYTRQVYDLLHNRFVLKLTQEETADRMHISRTSVHRAQRRAIHALARALWERSRRPGQLSLAEAIGEGLGPLEAEETASSEEAIEWSAQVQRELASLQAKSTDTTANVEEALQNVQEFMGALANRMGVQVEVKSLQPNLVAAVHPVVLQQVLISSLKRLAQHITDGHIDIYARLEDGKVKITLTGAVAASFALNETDFTSDIPLPEGMSLRTCVDEGQAFVWVTAPTAGEVITVLAVDDNEDMLRLYRSAAVGTRYHIVHTTHGQGLFEVIAATSPDVIVLDVMLPDVDGWRLLMRLHEDPATRAIPVVVCSVVHEEELALSLGAICYLPKPVRPREFIQALDRALALASTRARGAPTHSAQSHGPTGHHPS